VVEQYIDAARHHAAAALPLHPDAVCEFPTSTYRGAASFRKGLDDFARIMKSIEVIRLVVDGEHCVAIVNIDTVFGVIPFAEHIHVANRQIVSIRGYCDPRPMLGGTKLPPDVEFYRRNDKCQGMAILTERSSTSPVEVRCRELARSANC